MAAACPTDWTLVGTSTVCELRFTAIGTQSWVVPSGMASVDVLVVGAGGAGGLANGISRPGGGGGGGGIALLTDYAVNSGSNFSIHVGSGSEFVNANGRLSSFSLGGTWQARGNGGGNGDTSSGGRGGTGEVAGGLTGVALSGTAGQQGDRGTSASAGTLVDQGLFQVAGPSPLTPQAWSGGGGGGNTGNPGATGSTATNPSSPNSGGGGGGRGGHQTTTGPRISGQSGIVILRTDVAPTTAPGTPTISAINVGDEQLAVAFTVSDGGTALTAMEYSIDSGANWLPASGTTSPLTITGLENGVAYNVRVKATNAQGTGPPSATTTATPLGTALTPSFGSVTRTSDGFTVTITNYDSNYTWAASVGSIDAVSGVLTVTGLSAGASSTVTVSTSRATYSNGSANVTGTALSSALNPGFGSVTRTANGFTVSITNYDANYTWVATSGTVDSSGLLSVTGLAASATQTVTVSTSRSGYVDGSANVTGQALDAQTITWAPTTTELTMPAATFRPSSGAAAAGSITYSINNPGTTGCTLTSSTTPGPGRSTSTTPPRAHARCVRAPPRQARSPQPSRTLTSSSHSPRKASPLVRPPLDSSRDKLPRSLTPAAAATSNSITITVATPGGGGGGGGGSGGGGSSNGSPSDAGGSEADGGTGGASGSEGSGEVAQSEDNITVPGTGSTTRGRVLPPPPNEIEIQPLRGGARSSVLIKQPVGAAGSQVLATVVVVRNVQGKVISRINIELEPGQSQIRVTVPYVADGYTVDVYNVNEVGVSTGALTRSPLVRATTITKRTATGQPRLFGELLGGPIIFNGGSAALDTRDKKQLRAIARQAKASNERLFVTGFARKGGGTKSELASLSAKRARAAATYLSKQGVRVWIRYWGAGSLNGTGQASDRRVEVRTSAAPIPRTLVP
jgi:hypothetical protein